jgi:hypothetical protein
VDIRDVQLSLCRCLHVDGPLNSKKDIDWSFRDDSDHRGVLGGGRDTHGDRDRHDVPVPGIEVQGESPAEYHCRGVARLGRYFVNGAHRNKAGSVLHLLCDRGNNVHSVHHLVCFELETGSSGCRLRLRRGSRGIWNNNYHVIGGWIIESNCI